MTTERTAFVTGATGFLGTHLIQQLDQAGWAIIALHRPQSDLRELKKCRNVTLCIGDILDIESIRKHMPESVDAVFHVAGSVAHLPPKLESTRFDVNQMGTRNVVDVCLEKNIGRLLYTSTVLTYDFHETDLVTEKNGPNLWCRDPYIHSKRLADEEVQKAVSGGIDTVFLHPSAVFGSYDKATWSKVFLEIERGLPFPFSPPCGGSVCHVKSVAEAHVSAYHKGRRNEHYILGGPDFTWLQVFTKVSSILGKSPPKAALPRLLFKAIGWAEYLTSTYLLRRAPAFTPHAIDILTENVYSDSSKAKTELGYRPSSLNEMLMDCYHWMVAEGMLDRQVAVPVQAESQRPIREKVSV